MTFRVSAILCLVFTIQWRDVNSLESVEELLCQNSKIGSRIPHPEFCNVYIMCTDNSAMQISCQTSILFNPESNVCDGDYEICRSGQIRNEDGSVSNYDDDEIEEPEDEIDSEEIDLEMASTYVATTQLPIRTSTKAMTIVTTVALGSQQSAHPIACPRVDSDSLIILSHETKCSIYYICYHGKPIPMECSMGLFWSETHYKCVPKELSECHARSENMYPKCPQDGIDFLPHHEDCRWFWYCRNGFKMLQQCDAFDQWDINERKCKRAGRSLCYKDLLKSMNL